MRYAHLALAVFVAVMLTAATVGWLVRPTDPTTASTARTGFRVDLNRADAATLQLLPGIGARLADRVLAHRRDVGPFTSVDDLQAVSGVGPKTVERLRPYVACDAVASKSVGPTQSNR